MFFSLFKVEGMVVEHIMTLSELSVTSAPTLSFISDGSLSKLFLSQSKIIIPLLKYYYGVSNFLTV